MNFTDKEILDILCSPEPFLKNRILSMTEEELRSFSRRIIFVLHQNGVSNLLPLIESLEDIFGDDIATDIFASTFGDNETI